MRTCWSTSTRAPWVIPSLCLVPSPPVLAVAGLRCSLLVSVLHAGGHAGPRGAQVPPLPVQEMGRSQRSQGAPEQRGGGVVARGSGARLGGGAAGCGGLGDERDCFKPRWTRRLAVSQDDVMDLTVLMSRLRTPTPTPRLQRLFIKCVAFYNDHWIIFSQRKGCCGPRRADVCGPT